jgi:hypothetical protein
MENQDPAAPMSTSERLHLDWKGGVSWDGFFNERGMPGGVELIFASVLRSARVGELVLTCLVAVNHPDKSPVYPAISILIPKDGETTQEMVYGWIEDASARLRPTIPLSEKDKAIIERRVTVAVTADLRVASVIDHVDVDKGATLFLVLAATDYRDEHTTVMPVPEGTWVTDRDLWAPHLALLVQSCAEKVRDTDCFVIVDVGDELPPNPASRKLFDEMDNVGYQASSSTAMDEAFVLAQRCLDMMSAGRVSEALALVDAARDISLTQKVIVKAQSLHRGGHVAGALDEIKTAVVEGLIFDSRTTIGFASIANRAGDSELARDLLSRLDPRDSGEEALELVLLLARKLEMGQLADNVADLLDSRFPSQTGLRDETLDALKDLCAPDGVGNSRSIHGFSKDMREVASWLYCSFEQPVVSPVELLEVCRARWPALEQEICLCLAYGASTRNLIADTLKLATPSATQGRPARYLAQLLLEAMERHFVATSEATAPIELLADAALELIHYLARHPGDDAARVAFARVLSPETSGHTGLVVLIRNVLRLAQAEVSLSDEVSIKAEPASSNELMDFVKRASERLLPTHAPVGNWLIPDDLLVPSADALLGAVVKFSDFMQRHNNDKADLQLIEMMGGLGVALARRSSSPNTDLTILRIWGGHLASSNAPQRSRDIAQTILADATSDPVRCRLAWFGYGDIYHRGRNQLEALLGLACAMATGAALPPKEAADELHALMRVLRDTGLHDVSDSLMPAYERIMELAGAGEKDYNRAETARLSTAMRRVFERRSDTVSFLPPLIEDAHRNLEVAIALDDNPVPAALNLGQMVNVGRQLGIVIPDGVDESLTRTRALLSGTPSLIFDLVCGDLSAESLFEYTQLLDCARFAGDVGHDVEVLTVAARRLLAVSGEHRDAIATVYASELLADLGVTPPLGATAPLGALPWLPDAVERPAAVAKRMSTRGVDIQILATHARHRVMVSYVHDGELHMPFEIADEVFSIAHFQSWSRSYPFAYGNDRTTMFDNTFYDTMDRLRPGRDLTGPTIFVCDTRLQQLPPNIFLTSGNFAGRQYPVGMAPSLTWLERAVSVTPDTFGPSVAWISDASEPSADNTLNFLASLLMDTFDDHNIVLNRSITPPGSLRHAELAIVGAHGGLAEQNQYFRVVADEGTTRMTAKALADALDQCNVAILFVCSGGRVDHHPLSNSVLGLPKEILDGGRQAVIASPWPLDVRVPAHWLPVFLTAWEEGDNLLVANFKANQSVAARMGDDPVNCLSMTVYGNPLLTKA